MQDIFYGDPLSHIREARKFGGLYLNHDENADLRHTLQKMHADGKVTLRRVGMFKYDTPDYLGYSLFPQYRIEEADPQENPVVASLNGHFITD